MNIFAGALSLGATQFENDWILEPNHSTDIQYIVYICLCINMVNRTHKGLWAILCQTGESPRDMARCHGRLLRSVFRSSVDTKANGMVAGSSAMSPFAYGLAVFWEKNMCQSWSKSWSSHCLEDRARNSHETDTIKAGWHLPLMDFSRPT